jgi:hypothetical protein
MNQNINYGVFFDESAADVISNRVALKGNVTTMVDQGSLKVLLKRPTQKWSRKILHCNK